MYGGSLQTIEVSYITYVIELLFSKDRVVPSRSIILAHDVVIYEAGVAYF